MLFRSQFARERKAKGLPYFATKEEEGKYSISDEGKPATKVAAKGYNPKTWSNNIPTIQLSDSEIANALK